MFKKVAILLFFSAFGLCLNGADFNVTKGWNLLGTDNNISNLGIFKFQGIKYIWAFDNITKKWKVYAPEYNGSLPFDKLENINAKSGFWVYSDKNDSINLNICNLDLKSLGFEIEETYCSYSSDDIGRFWSKKKGFFNIATNNKRKKERELSNTFIHCGIYQKDKIVELGAQSPCYEAHVYWGK